MSGEKASSDRRRKPRGIALAVAGDAAGTLGELARMVWTRRLWWAVPALITLLVVGGLVLVTASPVAPLFYPLF